MNEEYIILRCKLTEDDFWIKDYILYHSRKYNISFNQAMLDILDQGIDELKHLGLEPQSSI